MLTRSFVEYRKSEDAPCCQEPYCPRGPFASFHANAQATQPVSGTVTHWALSSHPVLSI